MTHVGPLVETAGCLCLASRRAARAITRSFDRALRPSGVRATQFSVLAVLLLAGAKTIGELADALGLDRTTLTRNLALIEQRGWVRSRPGKDDARARHVEITAAGQAAIEAALPAWRAAQAATAGAIGDAGANALRRLSRRSAR
jgi:DNA-binding MarR family transcriptional regulator